MNVMDQKKEFETQEKIIEMIGEKDKAQRKRNLILEKVGKFLWSFSRAKDMSSYHILNPFPLTSTKIKDHINQSTSN
jgi:hypothetical protein